MSDPSYIATFAVMLTIALLGSSLTTRVKRQAIQSAQKAYRTEILLETSQKLQKAEGSREIPGGHGHPVEKAAGAGRPDLFRRRGRTGAGGHAVPLFPKAGICLHISLPQSGRWRSGSGTTTSTPALPPTPFPAPNASTFAVRGSDKVLAVVGIAIPNASEGGLL